MISFSSFVCMAVHWFLKSRELTFVDIIMTNESKVPVSEYDNGGRWVRLKFGLIRDKQLIG